MMNLLTKLATARGFEEIEKDEIRKDSPTCCKENFRLILSLVITKNWKINSLDIKSAFLHSQPILRDIFVKSPKDVNTTNLWQLLVTVYGLCDAPRAWYLKVKEVLEASEAIKSKFDHAIFYWLCKGNLEGILCCHVDDFVWGGTTNFKNKVITLLKETFSISLERCETFKYLRLDVCQNDNVITLPQMPYISELSECDVEKLRQGLLNSSLSYKEVQQLRTLAHISGTVELDVITNPPRCKLSSV